MSKELEALEARNTELEERIAKLEKAADPPPREPWTQPRFDPTEGMSMDRSTMREMLKGVPDALMNELRMDARRPNPVNPPSPPQPQPRQRATPNWVDERPLEPPPGISHCDALMDQQDAMDKAELVLKLWKAGMLKGE